MGKSDECDTGETVGQGTLEGAVISAVSLDKGVEEYFGDSEDEIRYAGLRLQPLLFQDDICGHYSKEKERFGYSIHV